MWSNLTQLSIPGWNLVFRAAIVYLSVLLLLRISGKRQLGQMGATEFVAILLISNAVQNAMNGGDNSLVGGLILALVLVFLSWLISVLTFRSKKMQTLFEGTPSLLIHRGEPVLKNMMKERITRGELVVLLRKQGIHQFNEVHTAILEADGVLSVTKTTDVNEGPRPS